MSFKAEGWTYFDPQVFEPADLEDKHFSNQGSFWVSTSGDDWKFWILYFVALLGGIIILWKIFQKCRTKPAVLTITRTAIVVVRPEDPQRGENEEDNLDKPPSYDQAVVDVPQDASLLK